jgi:hypothetical protein
MPQEGELHVSARVGVEACARSFDIVLRPCTKPKGFCWCCLLLALALILLIGGSVFFALSSAFLPLGLCIASAAKAAAIPTYGLSILGGVMSYAACVIVAVVSFAAIVLGLILFAFVLWQCRGCTELSSPVSYCDLLRWAHFFLLIIGVPVALLNFLWHIAGSFVGSICLPATGWLLNLGFMLVDMGAISLCLFVVNWLGNATGCFSSLPGIFFPHLQSLTSNATCLDRSSK